MDVSTSGTLTSNFLKKKKTFKWNLNMKPDKTKKNTFKVKANLQSDDKRTAVEVDASQNKDKTMNLKGTVTTIQGKNKITHPIDIKNYKPGSPMPMLM
jgi:hypothetical protein